jgi:hypothetical protein
MAAVNGVPAAGFGGAGNQQASVGSAGQLGMSPSSGAGAGGNVMPNVPNSGASGAGGSSAIKPTGPLAGKGGAQAGTTASGGMGGGAAPAPTGEICTRWKADRANLSEGTWSGNAATCDAGDMTKDARDAAYRLHSLYRFMAGLDPVPMTDDNNRKAQGCALMMAANGMISHMPDSTWKCYTAEAASTAGSSSLSSEGAVGSVDGYMIDPGNPTTIGHRRWVLSSMLMGVGFGSSGMFSCQYQPPGRPAAGAKPWVAWPPPGQIPIQAMSSIFMSIDQTGWSLQSDTIDFKSAQVAVTSGGMNLAVTVTQLGSGYGSYYAMRFNPMGWQSAAGNTYHVKVSGTSTPIEYDVEVVDCR